MEGFSEDVTSHCMKEKNGHDSGAFEAALANITKAAQDIHMP
jgi:hypothetical protein